MDLQSVVALSTLPGICRIRAAAIFKELREHAGCAVTLDDVIRSSAPNADVGLVTTEARAAAERLLERARSRGVAAVRWNDAGYPPLLGAIVDPPPLLWVRGRILPLTRPAVAIVGSRAASPYAIEVATRLGSELAERGLVVVSGLARGVDGAAHRGCLCAGGSTVAVLGSGPDIIYPSEHAELAASICENGTLLSELGPGAPPLPAHFPLRNRLISGISMAVVVVEASEKSGSLITARCALEQGRDVMAVPGSVLSGRNRGSHALLKDGAAVVETADDILEGLGWPAGAPRPGSAAKSLPAEPLLDRLAIGETYDLDTLVTIFGLPGPRLLARITEWEMRGRLVRFAGGRYGITEAGPARGLAAAPTGRPDGADEQR
ncbi:MAG: DNA-protecting protein DprA [Acidobacteria bacterium]|nr:DNA-protecting protein DprA [Acidobacteriota bacterium]